MPTIGELPKPQAIFLGFEPGDPAIEAMGHLVAGFVCDPDPATIRAKEWDLIVQQSGNSTAGLYRLTHGDQHILSFGGPSAGSIETSIPTYSFSIDLTWELDQPSNLIHIPDDLDDELERLVKSELVPWLSSLNVRPYLPRADGLSVTAFAVNPEGYVIAGDYPRGRYGSGRLWALPFVPERPERWLAAALRDWHLKTPNVIPRSRAWRTRPTWLSNPESLAAEALAVAQHKREQLVSELDAKVFALEGELAAVSASADQGIRKLLTAQGDELAETVTTALKNLGFTVHNVDDLRPTGSKVDDLRLEDPADTTWTNITEVKGYTKGAKAGDLQILANYAALYAVKHHAMPTSRWYVVNQFCNADPDDREVALASAEDQVEIFAQFGGLLVDTRELFKLINIVDAGTLTPAHARNLLRHQTGRFTAPIPAEVTTDSP